LATARCAPSPPDGQAPAARCERLAARGERLHQQQPGEPETG
jgi:hypothetical protein